MKQEIFIFVLDDTLINSDPIYHGAFHKVSEMIRVRLQTNLSDEEFGKIFYEIEKDIHEKINPKTKKPYLYTKERFIISLIWLYRKIRKDIFLDILPDDNFETEIRREANKFFMSEIYRKAIKGESFELFKFLYERECKLFILTKGDREVQKEKIGVFKEELRKRDIRCDFNFNVVERHKSDFGKFKNGLPGKLRSVGNSYSHDIEPATREGHYGILIPFQTWETNIKKDIELASRDSRCRIFDNLLDIKKKFYKL